MGQHNAGAAVEGATLRDEGARLALDAAWHLWRMTAQETLAELADSGREFDADDLVDEVGLPPVTGSPNAMGGLFAGAYATGLIEPVGYTTSVRRSRRFGVIRRWRGGATMTAALIDTSDEMTVAHARAAGHQVASLYPDRAAMAARATAFIEALPDPRAPQPAPGITGDQADAVRAAWIRHSDRLRAAYSHGYAEGRTSWADQAAAS